MVHAMGPVSPKLPSLWHGGDYNPEQWPAEVWEDDFRLMQKAGVTVVTVGVFSWVSLQPAEDVFTFDWLDKILDGAYAHGIHVILATPSAAQPAWMSRKYPTMLRSSATGVRNGHSGRTNYCPNSPDYRRLSGRMAGKLAERYGQHPALLLWHVGNEYAGSCVCDTCAEQFRVWLQAKYGTLDELNARWWTAFWSHSFTDWSEIDPPRQGGEIHMHGLNVDYFRFMTESQLACYCNERDILRAATPDIPITTNFMGGYKPLDYRRWAREVDVISWDCYPHPGQSPGEIAFMHDLQRGLKDGQPFLLMEQTPSSQNWQTVNALKRPGILRLWSYLAVAHGADSVLYFQWRRGRGGVEKLHGAVIEHAGREDTRVFREVRQLGQELCQLGDSVVGSRLNARVGIVFDWDNWHGLDGSVGPVRNKRYYETVVKHYLAFYRQNIPVDVLFADSDLSGFDIVIAPMLYMVKAGFADRVEAFVKQGGAFLTTYLSGLVDETDLAFANGYPGPLASVLGVWVEEIDALYDGQHNTLVMTDGREYRCENIADVLHAEGAEVLATYGSDFYQGMPVLTRHAVGKGAAYYLGSDADAAFLDDFYGELARSYQLRPALVVPEGVEVTVRTQNDRALLFVLNHRAEPVEIDLGGRTFNDLLNREQVAAKLVIEGYGVHLLVEQPVPEPIEVNK